MSRSFYRIISSLLCTAMLVAQEPAEPTFRSASSLVLVPFNVKSDKRLITNLQSSDFILREDGHPREFTIFEGPHTGKPLPVELVLLFDTSPAPKRSTSPLSPWHHHMWDPKVIYEFLRDWDESTTRTILQESGRDISLSVYRFDDGHFERLCRASRDPHEIDDAFGKLLSPIPAKERLALLPGDKADADQGETWGSPGWWKEATVATLSDVAASPIAAHRFVFLFSDFAVSGATGTNWPAFWSNVRAFGITVDPVELDPLAVMISGPHRGERGNPTLGEMSGGEKFAAEHLDRDTLIRILMGSRNRTLSRYYVGFIPVASAKAKKHSLQVELKPKTPGKVVGGERDDVIY